MTETQYGNLSPNCLANFQVLLAKIHLEGFQEVELAMFPIYHNDPNQWSGWDETTYQQKWNLIANLKGAAEQSLSGTQFLFDLQNELAGVANVAGDVRVSYIHRLWSDYSSQPNWRGTSFGFSYAVPINAQATDQSITAGFVNIYGAGNFPYTLSVHIGSNNATLSAQASNISIRIWQQPESTQHL